MSAQSESAVYLRSRPGRSRRLTLKACVWDSATWCSPAWPHPTATATAFRGPRVAGAPSTVQALRGHTGEGTIAAASMATTTTQATVTLSSSLGVTACLQGGHLPGGTTCLGAVSARAGEVVGYGTVPRRYGGPPQGAAVSRGWAGVPASPLRFPMAHTCPTRKTTRCSPTTPILTQNAIGEGTKGHRGLFFFYTHSFISNPLNTYFIHMVSTKFIHCSSGSKNVCQMGT